MRSRKLTLLAAALLGSTAAWAADPVPTIGPAPAWVQQLELPAPDPLKKDAPVQILVASNQERVRADGIDNYFEMVAVPQTTAGLQALGNVTLPWNAEKTDLVLHDVSIRRGDQTINILEKNDFVVLRRENNLERAVLDGIRTVVIPARGLETGDILRVRATYKSRAVSVGARPDELMTLDTKLPIKQIHYRVLVPDDVALRWKFAGDLKPQVTRRDAITEHVITLANVEPLTVPKNTPARFKSPVIQYSAYPGWGAIGAELQPHFLKARKTAADSALAREIDKIAATTADPEKRLIAALRLAQDRIRYVALLLGEGAYVPASADETWERRFGDCKGKTVTLLAMLDRLGIEAEPVLVSTTYDDRLSDQLPSLALFDHVIVRAKLAGRSYYLDATDYGQRTLAELSASSFTHALPLDPEADLEPIASAELAAPTREVSLTWDASAGIEGDIPYEGTLTLRDVGASAYRAKLGSSTDPKEFDTSLKEMMPGVENDALTIVEKIPDAADGSFVVRFKGKADMDWSPFEGDRDSRFAFSNSTMHWDAEFDRAEGPGKDWPVSLGTGRFWERTTETVILPDSGRRFRVDGQPLEKKLAGSSMSRALYQDGNRITMVSNFRHHQREITAADARAAEPVLEELKEDWAYIVGPRERTQPKK